MLTCTGFKHLLRIFVSSPVTRGMMEHSWRVGGGSPCNCPGPCQAQKNSSVLVLPSHISSEQESIDGGVFFSTSSFPFLLLWDQAWATLQVTGTSWALSSLLGSWEGKEMYKSQGSWESEGHKHRTERIHRHGRDKVPTSC